MGVSLLIVCGLMNKGASRHLMQSNRYIVSVSFMQGSLCLSLLLHPAAQACRLTSFWWLALAAWTSILPFLTPFSLHSSALELSEIILMERKKVKCTCLLGFVSIYSQPCHFKKGATLKKGDNRDGNVKFMFEVHSSSFSSYSLKSKCLS